MSANPDRALAALLPAWFADFADFAGRVAVERGSCDPWCSATFAGARHRLALIVEGDGAVGAAADFLADMAELELPIRGHIVADLALVSEARDDRGRWVRLELEALTIAE